MQEFTLTEDRDIIVDTGEGIYIITQEDKRIKRSTLNLLLKNNKIYYDRTQWWQDFYLTGDENNRIWWGDKDADRKNKEAQERIDKGLSKSIKIIEGKGRNVSYEEID